MKQCNFSMSIGWDGESLFLFAAAPTEADWLHSRQDPVLERWKAYMTGFMETDETGNIAIEPLEKSFGFGQFQ